MRFNSKTLFLISLIAFLSMASFAFSEALSEYTLSDAGFNGLLASGTEVQECSEVQLQKGSIYSEEAGVYSILSIHADFKPISEGNAKVSVFYKSNPKAIAEFSPQDFINGWARVDFTKGLEESILKICAQTSGSISAVEVFADSKMGYYKAPEFVIEKTVSNTRPLVGKELEVTLKATNIGSAPSFAKMSYRDIELRIAQITRGDSEFEGIISPGESVELSYFVKPKYAVQMDLASAIIEYTDVFGDSRKVYSNRPTIYVQSPEFNIKSFFTLEKQETLAVSKSFNVVLTLRNEGQTLIENAVVKLEPSPGLQLSQDSIELESLAVGETRNFTIGALGTAEGSSLLGCTVEYLDYSAVNVKCTPITLEFEKQSQDFVLMLAVVLLIVGALIYLYIYAPDRKSPERKQ